MILSHISPRDLHTERVDRISGTGTALPCDSGAFRSNRGRNGYPETVSIHRVRKTPPLSKSETTVVAYLAARGPFVGAPELLVMDLRFRAGLRVDYAWKAVAGVIEKGLVEHENDTFRVVPRRRAA